MYHDDAHKFFPTMSNITLDGKKKIDVTLSSTGFVIIQSWACKTRWSQTNVVFPKMTMPEDLQKVL